MCESRPGERSFAVAGDSHSTLMSPDGVFSFICSSKTESLAAVSASGSCGQRTRKCETVPSLSHTLAVQREHVTYTVALCRPSYLLPLCPTWPSTLTRRSCVPCKVGRARGVQESLLDVQGQCSSLAGGNTGFFFWGHRWGDF